MNRAPQRWREVLATFGSPARPRGGPDGEQIWLGPKEWCGIHVWMPRTPAVVVVCPKTATVGWWLAGGGVPRDFGFICTAHPSDARSREVLERVGRTRRLVYVGDLDPLGLVQYLELRRNLARRKVHVRFGGIDDQWLTAMARGWSLTGDASIARVALGGDERRLLAKLDRAVDLKRLAGPAAAALLRGGQKVEMEGATNPAAYGPRHTRSLFRYLRATAARDSA